MTSCRGGYLPCHQTDHAKRRVNEVERWRAGRARVVVTALLGAAALAAAGCGGDDEGGTPAPPPPPQASPPPAAEGGTTLRNDADPTQLAFEKRALTAKANRITLVMDNPSATPHNIALEGPGVSKQGEVVSRGGTSEVTADLKPGKYTFYCSVVGHREAGMDGTLTVE
jgi:plastocyanin